MVKVSVVIPIYNVEEYLEECLDSICNQTLKDIEIICVNDGSSDNSLDILNEYATKDNRFQIISQENSGHAVATNNGMKLAKGKYIYLMDSDDILKCNALEDVVNVAEEKNVDFVIFQAINYYMDKNQYVKKENYSMNKLADFVDDNVFNWNEIGELIFDIAVTPWSKLYNREFIEKHDITFPEGLVFDDNVFFWEVLFNSKRIAFHRSHLFIRRWYSSSSTMNGGHSFIDLIEIFHLIWETFKKHGVFDEFKDILYHKRIHTSFRRLKEIKEEFKDEYFDLLKKSFIEIKDEKNFDSAFKNLSNRDKLIFNSVFEVSGYKELLYIIRIFDLEQKNVKLKESNKKLNKKLKKCKRINKEMINSNSWKITKPIRNFTNLFK